jgi:hypothetical protein
MSNCTEKTVAPFVIAKATAFPQYFKPWKFNVTSNVANVAGDYELIDAGLIDNLGIHAFLPLFRQRAPAAIPDVGNVWFRSNAGAALTFPTGVPIGRAGDFWLESRKPKLSWLDRAFRYSGDLTQPVFEEAVTNFVTDYTKFKVTGVMIGAVPDSGDGPEELWHSSCSLPNADSVRCLPTALSRMKREDALCVLIQGAQSASYALKLPDTKRKEIKQNLVSLL